MHLLYFSAPITIHLRSLYGLAKCGHIYTGKTTQSLSLTLTTIKCATFPDRIFPFDWQHCLYLHQRLRDNNTLLIPGGDKQMLAHPKGFISGPIIVVLGVQTAIPLPGTTLRTSLLRRSGWLPKAEEEK